MQTMSETLKRCAWTTAVPIAYSGVLSCAPVPPLSCFFRGGEVYKSGTPGPVPIASLWPNLPPSFQQGVDGATYLNDSLHRGL